LKNDYPDLHQLLIERFTQKENNLVN